VVYYFSFADKSLHLPTTCFQGGCHTPPFATALVKTSWNFRYRLIWAWRFQFWSSFLANMKVEDEIHRHDRHTTFMENRFRFDNICKVDPHTVLLLIVWMLTVDYWNILMKSLIIEISWWNHRVQIKIYSTICPTFRLW
jgi:hypothetical protein